MKVTIIMENLISMVASYFFLSFLLKYENDSKYIRIHRFDIVKGLYDDLLLREMLTGGNNGWIWLDHFVS